jgi:F0F1-type ATP synthase assembly protein I
MQGSEFDRVRVGEYLPLGCGFALAILLFAYLGWWLDQRLGSTPAFTLVGTFVGAVAGFYSMYRRVMALQDDGKRGNTEDDGGTTPSERARDEV